MPEPFATIGRAGRCNCEDSACLHTQDGHSCSAHCDDRIVMDQLGPVCAQCAAVTRAAGGARYLTVRSATAAR